MGQGRITTALAAAEERKAATDSESQIANDCEQPDILVKQQFKTGGTPGLQERGLAGISEASRKLPFLVEGGIDWLEPGGLKYPRGLDSDL